MKKRVSWIDNAFKKSKEYRVLKLAIRSWTKSIEEDKNSAVNIVDHPTDGEISGREQLSFPSEFPGGEDQSEVALGPEFSQYKMPRQAEMGQSLTDLTTEKHQVRTKQKLTEPGRWSDSYHDDNQFEDADLKLGEGMDALSSPVYPPYTDGIGQPNPRYEDVNKEKYNVVVHAEENEKGNTGDERTTTKVYQGASDGCAFDRFVAGNRETLNKLNGIEDKLRHGIYKHAGEENLTPSNLSKIYELEYKIDQLDRRPHLGVVAIKAKERMENELKITLAEVIDGMRDLYDWWLEDTSFIDDLPEGRPVVDRIKEVRKTLKPTGNTHQDMATFSIALNTAHSTGPMSVYLTRYYNIPVSLLNDLTKGKDVPTWESDVKRWANRVASVTEDDPTKMIKEYKGLVVNVEWPKGSIRSYEGNDTYVTHMKTHYGFVDGVEGCDEDSLDVYLNDEGNSDKAFIVDQLKDTGEFDEAKTMIGFDTAEEAADMYLQHMPAYMLGDIREVPIEKLVNALYGEPEDRRGQEDLVPSEEVTAQKIFKPKVNKRTKSDYVGPQTSQSGGIGGPAADKESTKTWPGNANDENIYTDPDETRENRDIPRPQETEKMVYRNT